MPLIAYPSSDDDEANHAEAQTVKQPSTAPPTKRRKLVEAGPLALPASSPLPALPAAFHDLYSSTVRTGAYDDPSLHAGRKRGTPHVEGNWPAHVFLQWCPSLEDSEKLASLISASTTTKSKDDDIYSLLQNDLGVSLPLHISLSRPMVLKTDTKAMFLDQIKNVVLATGVREFYTNTSRLRWHPNESKTRWFLVLQMEECKGKELPRLLEACNEVVRAFGQPELYGKDAGNISAAEVNHFHISVAWSLHDPGLRELSKMTCDGDPTGIIELDIPFDSVKVRIGQDVTILPLAASRKRYNIFS